MSIFAEQLNPLTGRREWNVMPDDYDFQQEVARSAYADMLHDTERNDKYYEGVRRAVKLLRERGDRVKVLDIGTGTGLLSMMAVKCGADTVTACEAFEPMAECAKKQLVENGCDKVRLISKRSTEMEVGPGKDMEERANLLVAELFDTELIGEGAIQTYTHARDNLLTADAVLVPSEGTIYAQVVSSEMMERWNKILPVVDDGDEVVSVPRGIQQCGGTAAVHDIQLSQVPREWFTPLSPPLPVFKFDWSGRVPDGLAMRATETTPFMALAGGTCHAVFMWWDIMMDTQGEVMLSCAPYWAHPHTTKGGGKREELPWRDHWMQGVYYPPATHRVHQGQHLSLISSHDEYSLWFNVEVAQHTRESATCAQRPVCECGAHIANSRTRIGQLNDPRRREVYLRVLRRMVKCDSVVMAIGDGCLVALTAAKMGARHVYLLNADDVGNRVVRSFVSANSLEGKVTILSAEAIPESLPHGKVDVVFSEPCLSTSLLPWHNLSHWYTRQSIQHLCTTPALPAWSPVRATLWGLPVLFRDLWKIRSPLRTCCDFKMDVFDELILTASEQADEKVEPHPLWEYPCLAQGPPIQLLTLPLTSPGPPEAPVTHSGLSPLPHTPQGRVNGVAVWVDWWMSVDEGDVVTTGPVEKVVVGEQVQWDLYTRQGVYLLPTPRDTGSTISNSISNSLSHSLFHSTTFDPKDGTIKFDFDVCKTAKTTTAITKTTSDVGLIGL